MINMEQTINKKNLLLFWFIFIVLYLFVCTAAAFVAMKAKKDTQVSIKKIRAEQIKKLLKEKNIKGFSENQPDNIYNESLYNQGGGINPGFKNIVSKQANSSVEPSARAYEKQLAEYRLRLAEEKQRQLEIKRQQEKQAAEQRALIEQQMLERKKQQELQQQQLLEMQKAQVAQAANTGTQKSAGVQKTAQPAQQKTQIGKLKTSKLGESSFQKQKF